MSVHEDRVGEFHRLHEAGCFVMPNPWDAGSAKALERMGFKALATTSAGLAWTLGCADDQVSLDQTLAQYRRLRERNVTTALTVGSWTHTQLMRDGAPVVLRETLDWLGTHLAGRPSAPRSPVRVHVNGGAPGDEVVRLAGRTVPHRRRVARFEERGGQRPAHQSQTDGRHR